jgi:hypothetical protein
MGDGLIALKLDCYSVHRSERAKELASQLGIDLYFIPPGTTDEPQPLDRSVFAVLKAAAKKPFHRRYTADPYGRRTKPEAVQDLLTAWGTLPPCVIVDGWGIYGEEYEAAATNTQ